MASSGGGFGFRGAGRLDASEQTIVFCHVCNHEWPRNERESIVCPRCNSEVTEIVEPDSDPRDMPDLDPFSFLSRDRPQNNNRQGSDSDPDEFDIESHVPPGAAAFLHRSGYHTLARSMEDRQERLDRERERRLRERRDEARPPVGGEDIIWRFADVLHQMGAAGATPPRRGGLFTEGGVGGRDRDGQRETQAGRDNEHDSPFMTPRIHRTTIRSGPFGGGITITSSTYGRTTSGADPVSADFDRIFGNLMGPPAPPSPGERQNRPPGAQMGGFAALLQELLGAAVNPASAVHGDAVYTQEALDRIVSTLMEAHPQSNAAPPATQTAIEQLEKKKLDQEMMGSEGKAECTICIDEMHLGDEVTVLPCTHWFHGECVTMWLKEHNTCPICRRAIETTSERRERRATGSRSEQDTASPGGPSLSTAGPSSADASDARARRLRALSLSFSGWPEHDRPEERTRRDGDTSPYSRSFFYSSGSNPRTPDSPPPRIQMPGDFPSAFRDLDTNFYDRQRERDREQQLERDRARQRDREREQREQDQATSSSSRFSFFDSSGLGRRENSSGSHQSRDGSRGNSDSGGGSGSASGGNNSHNPFGWIRNHFGSGRNSGGGSGSGNGSSGNAPDNRRWRS